MAYPQTPPPPVNAPRDPRTAVPPTAGPNNGLWFIVGGIVVAVIAIMWFLGLFSSGTGSVGSTAPAPSTTVTIQQAPAPAAPQLADPVVPAAPEAVAPVAPATPDPVAPAAPDAGTVTPAPVN